MLAERRHQLILQALRSGGTVTVTNLTAELDVSAATVRRDLVRLEEEGRLSRVHGGAVIEEDDQPFVDAAGIRVAEKDAIAAHAATMIEDGQSVLLDIGTTTYRLARQLRGRRLTVITSNLVVYEELAGEESIELVLLGGMVVRESRSLTGFLTEDSLRQLQADWLFLGTSGIRSGGQVMDTTVMDVPARRAMIAVSDKVVLLADKSKFPGTGMVKVCGPEDLDVVVTNAPLGSEIRLTLEDAGVSVVGV